MHTIYSGRENRFYLIYDLRRAVIRTDTKLAEFSPPKTTKFTWAKKAADNVAAFKSMKEERNKLIGSLFRNIASVKKFEDIDCVTVDQIKHVRRIFEKSFAGTRGEDVCVSNVTALIRERNDLLADFPIAIHKRNALLAAFNAKQKEEGGDERIPLDTTAKVKQYADDFINTKTLASNGGVLSAMTAIRKFIAERDRLYEELHGIGAEIKEMSGNDSTVPDDWEELADDEPAAAASTASGVQAPDERAKTGGLPASAKDFVPPVIPSLSGRGWDAIPGVLEANKAQPAVAGGKSDGSRSTSADPPPEQSKRSYTDRAKAVTDRAKAVFGLGPAKPPAEVKGDSSDTTPSAASHVQVSTSKGGDPAAQSPAPRTVVHVPAYTPGVPSADGGVGPPAASSGRGGAQAIITEHVDTPPQSALQVVAQQHIEGSGSGVSKEEHDDDSDVDDRTELDQLKAELAESNKRNTDYFDLYARLAKHVKKTKEDVSLESIVVKLVAFEDNVRKLVQGEVILTQDEMVGVIQARTSERPALIAAIRHEILKVDPNKEAAFQDNVVDAVRSYVEEAAAVFGQFEGVANHDGLMKRIKTVNESAEIMEHENQSMHATMTSVAKAAGAAGKSTDEVIAAIVAVRKLNGDIRHQMDDCLENVLLDRVKASKTKYKDFETQIASQIPPELEKDKDGKLLSVLERVKVWHELTKKITHVADTGFVNDVVRHVQGFKNDIIRLTSPPPVGSSGPSTGSGAGGVDTAAVARAAEVLKICKERGDNLETQFNQSQASLHAAHLAKLEAERLQHASDAKLIPLELELTHLRADLHDARQDLDNATAPSQPFVMNGRLVSLLDDLHDVMHIEFQKDPQYDRHRIIKAITTAIFNAFPDTVRNDALRQVMAQVMVEFECRMTEADLRSEAATSTAYYARLADRARGEGTHGLHAGGEDEDEESRIERESDDMFRSRMRRVRDRGEEERKDSPREVDTSSMRMPERRTYRADDADRSRPTRPSGEGCNGAVWEQFEAHGRNLQESIAGAEARQRESVEWRRKRGWSPPPGEREESVAGSRAAGTASKKAHIECVSNWLHDLSQMIEPSSP
jgi:hypothetical protein